MPNYYFFFTKSLSLQPLINIHQFSWTARVAIEDTNWHNSMYNKQIWLYLWFVCIIEILSDCKINRFHRDNIWDLLTRTLSLLSVEFRQNFQWRVLYQGNILLKKTYSFYCWVNCPSLFIKVSVKIPNLVFSHPHLHINVWLNSLH